MSLFSAAVLLGKIPWRVKVTFSKHWGICSKYHPIKRNQRIADRYIMVSSMSPLCTWPTKDQPSYIECTKILNAVTPMINLLHPPQDTSGYQTSPLKLLWTFATMWKNCRKVILIKIRFFVHHILFPFSKSVGKLAMSLFGASLLTVASTA